MMRPKAVLIVDDEKNIRLTLSQALEALELETDSAVNGEEALAKIEQNGFRLVLLDLKMPGMDGMEVLRRLRAIRPDIRVIILTAHGTIESAVEAMKLGAVDFIQKPFAPAEIRSLVSRVLDRDQLDADKAADYTTHIELAKRCVQDGRFAAAVEHVHSALALEPNRAEAYNLLGALAEIQGARREAQKYYRAALALDPAYVPARENLHRVVTFEGEGDIVLTPPPEAPPQTTQAPDDTPDGEDH